MSESTTHLAGQLAELQVMGRDDEAMQVARQLCAAAGTGDVPDPASTLALLCAVKKSPRLFRDEGALSIILGWLRLQTDIRTNSRGAVLHRRLACNVLLQVFRDCNEWPVEFIQAYMDDALGPRGWVDDESLGCRAFLKNLKTAWSIQEVVADIRGPGLLESPSLRPRSVSIHSEDGRARQATSAEGQTSGTDGHMPPPLSLPAASQPTSAQPRASSAATTMATADSESDSGDEEVLEEAVVGQEPATVGGEQPLPVVWPRYQQQAQAHQVILQALKARMDAGASQQMWPLIKTLQDLCTLAPCRVLAAQHLQKWLTSPAHSNAARSLLASLVKEVGEGSEASSDDEDVMDILLKLKLPSQQLGLYSESMAALVQKGPGCLRQMIQCFLSDAIGKTRSDGPKTLASIVQGALAHAEARRGKAAPWLSKASVGLELARVVKGLLLQQSQEQQPQPPAPQGRVKEALLTVVKALTLEALDLLVFVRELLELPPDPVAVLGSKCRTYTRSVADCVSELLRYRALVCIEMARALNEQHNKQKRLSGGASLKDDELLTQKHLEHWRLRLMAVQDISEIHAAAADFCLKLVKRVFPAAPPPSTDEGSKGQAATSTDGLVLFRTMLLLVDDSQEKPNDKTLESFVNRYVGVKSSTCISLAKMARTSYCVPAPRVLEQIEVLVRRAARIAAKREQDKVVQKLALEPGLDGVELQFDDLKRPPDQQQAHAEAVIKALISLARYKPEGPKQDVSSLPDVANVELFWRVTLVLIVVGASNSASIGRWLWQSCPTVRCMMQMVVCGKFQFPPPGADTILRQQRARQKQQPLQATHQARDDSSQAGSDSEQIGGLAESNVPVMSMIEADADLAEQEAALMSALRGDDRHALKKRKKRGQPASSSLPPKKERKLSSTDAPRRATSDAVEVEKGPRVTRSQTAKGSVGRKVPDLIFLDLSMPSRRPPPQVLEQLQKLDAELGIGARLRRSTSPDFVAAAIAGDDSHGVSRPLLESSMGWLAPAVAAEPEVTMNRLPLPIICHMLMMAQVEADKQQLAAGHQPQRQEAFLIPSAPPKLSPEPSISGGMQQDAFAASFFASTVVDILPSTADILAPTQDDALFKLCEPLRHVVRAAVFTQETESGPGQQSDSWIALNVFMTELKASSSHRRLAARSALEQLMSPQSDSDAMQVEVEEAKKLSAVYDPSWLVQEARRERCSWAFQLHLLPAFASQPRRLLRALYDALQVEASHEVICLYLLALHKYCHGHASSSGVCRARYGGLPQAGGGAQGDMQQQAVERSVEVTGELCSPSFFSFVVAWLFTTRNLVIQATMQRLPRLREVMVSELLATLQDAAKQACSGGAGGDMAVDSQRLWQSDRLVRLTVPCADGPEPREATLPHALLTACIAVLSTQNEPDVPDTVDALLRYLLPVGEGPEVAGGRRRAPLGAAGAVTVDEREDPALTSDDWIRLVKCENPLISDVAAHSIPVLLLPRLFLCSGLPQSSFSAALRRINDLGRHDPSGEIYRDLLAPASTAAWGMARALGSRKALTRKLWRRLTAYVKMEEEGSRDVADLGTAGSESGGGFLRWLQVEVNNSIAKGARSSRPGPGPNAPTDVTSHASPTATAVRPSFTVASVREVVPQGTAQSTAPWSAVAPPPAPAPLVEDSQEKRLAAVLLSLSGRLERPRPPPLSTAPSSTSQAPQPTPTPREPSVTESVLLVREVQRAIATVPADDAAAILNKVERALATGSPTAVAVALSAVRPLISPLRRFVSSSRTEGAQVATRLRELMMGRYQQELSRDGRTEAGANGRIATQIDGRLAGAVRLMLVELYELCQHWNDPASGTQANKVLWDLALTHMYNTTLRSGALRVLATSDAAVLEHLMKRSVPSGRAADAMDRSDGEHDEPAVDVVAAMGLLQRYFRHPDHSAIVTDDGVMPLTVAAVASCPGSGAGGKNRLQRTSTYTSGNLWSHLSPSEMVKIASLFVDGLVHPPTRLAPGRQALCGRLCLRLACRGLAFRTHSLEQLLRAATSQKANTEALDGVLLRMYLAFPAEFIRQVKAVSVSAKDVVMILSRGEAVVSPALQSAIEKRLTEDVVQVCAFGHDPAKDGEALASLLNIARRHPFLLLRHLHALTQMLRADATPRRSIDTARPPLRFRMPQRTPPPFEPAPPIVPVGNKLVRVRISYWGSAFHPNLWQTLLNTLLEIPIAAVLAFTSPSTRDAMPVMEFVDLYIRLLAANDPPSETEVSTSPVVALASGVRALTDALERHEKQLISAFMQKELPGVRLTPAAVLVKYRARGLGQAAGNDTLAPGPSGR